ncbi:MAG: hypothetical protein KGI71_03305 [Patescibacteria group bacterium]|nr:hypothetical protein [Patescibacteria group bacterium]
MMPNDFGKSVTTVEDCTRLSIKYLLAHLGEDNVTDWLNAKICVAQQDIRLVTTRAFFGGLRYWFCCPQCDKKLAVLLWHPDGRIGCRECLGVDYRARRFKGMVEGVAI